MEKKRSKGVGVTICAIMFFIISIRGFAALIKTIILSYTSAYSKLFNCTLLFFISLLFFVTSIGLWLLKNWARFLAVFCSIILFLLGIFFVLFIVAVSFKMHYNIFLSIIVASIMCLTIPSLLIYFFINPKVKSQFSSERGKVESKETV
jgi:uncharacterized membrane protein (DUF2068 family)